MNTYQFGINRALNFIEDHLFEDLTLELIAKQSAMSAYHFHRIFSAMVEITLAQYIRDRRLTEVLKDLRDPDCKIIDIALKSGFESQEAFTRAFKSLFKMTPGVYRKAMMNNLGIPRFPTSEAEQAVADSIQKPQIVFKEAFRVVGLGKAISGTDFQAAYSLWADYSTQSAKYFNSPEADSFGICCPSHPQVPSQMEQHIYIASHVVNQHEQIPPGFIDLHIPEATYAKFIHRGHVSTVQATIKKIWKSWLPHSGLEVADGPDFEVYESKRFSLNSNYSEVDIYIPIKKGR